MSEAADPELDKLKSIYRQVLGSEAGRRIFQDLWWKFGGISFDENPILMAGKEGRRYVLFYLLAMSGRMDYKNLEDLWQRQTEAAPPESV